MRNEYALLDSGDGCKLERFGSVVTSRPCGQATWAKQEPDIWTESVVTYDRERGWHTADNSEIPDSWEVTINDIVMSLKPTPAGHLGVFPETRMLWDWISETFATDSGESASILNLFAHSGGATLAAARAGCRVCHVDASKSMVARARENAALNHLEAAPIRWIVDDVGKFMDREIRRGRRYDTVFLDPPSFGHGARGEQYRFDRDLTATLEQCRALLSDGPARVLLTAHTQGVTAKQMETVLRDSLGAGQIESGDMELTGASDVRPVGDGVWTRWTRT